MSFKKRHHNTMDALNIFAAAHTPFTAHHMAFNQACLDRHQSGQLICINPHNCDWCYNKLNWAGAERLFPNFLRLEVIALLCMKAAILIVIYYAFFASAEKPEPNGQTVLTHFLNYRK